MLDPIVCMIVQLAGSRLLYKAMTMVDRSEGQLQVPIAWTSSVYDRTYNNSYDTGFANK